MSSYVYSPEGKYYAWVIWLWTGMNANTGESKSLPVYHKLLPGCFCSKSSGRYIFLLTREMTQCCLTQHPWEECWQIYKLSIAQWWEAPTIFRTAQVSDRCHAELKRSWCRAWQWECLRKEGFEDTSSAAPWHYAPKQHLSKLSCKKPVRCGSSSRSHSALLWRLQ